jgi:hypothetical protein
MKSISALAPFLARVLHCFGTVATGARLLYSGALDECYLTSDLAFRDSAKSGYGFGNGKNNDRMDEPEHDLV